MKKITDFIVNKRYLILITFIILTLISFGLSTKVNINYEIAEYLPKDSETRIGMNIMENEFSKETSSYLNVMFKDLDQIKLDDIYNELIKIAGVDQVEYDKTETYNKDNYTLYIISVDAEADSQLANNIYQKVKNKYQDYELYMSGDIYNKNHSVLPTSIVVLAVFCAMIILIIMCESYVEPFLFLFAIGLAVILNNGTNIIFNNVSNITSSISAILQMALSMDYSIMLINRYRQEREKDNNKVSAMKKALYNAFKSISSSSITTIVGLVVLVFMSFTIGRDLGFVLAKGVLFSLISIFFCLPGLILTFDSLIQKTKKKTPNINLKILGNFNFSFNKLILVLFVIVFIASYFLKGNLEILYADSEDNKIKEIFQENNQIAIIYNNTNEEAISSYCHTLEDNKKIASCLSYGNTINEKLRVNDINNKINKLGSDIQIDDYLLKLLIFKYHNQNKKLTLTLNEFINFLNNDIFTNQDLSSQINQDLKENINKLSNFTNQKLITQKRTSTEIATVLEMEKSQVEDILIYYLSKTNNNNLELSITQFLNLINQDILTNEKYQSLFDEETKNNLSTLTKFNNSDLNTKKLTSQEMAQIFGLGNELTTNLYNYYAIIKTKNLKLTINEFANFILTDVLTNPNYSFNFDDNLKARIALLATFSNPTTINKNMTSSELANLFQVDEDIIKQLLLLKYSAINSDTKLTINDFITTTIYLKNNTNYLQNIDINTIEKLAIFSQNQNNINTTKLDKKNLSNLFNTLDSNLVELIYTNANLPDDYLMSPYELIDFTLINFSNYLESEQSYQLNLLKIVIENSLTDNALTYSSNELAILFNLDSQIINSLYVLIDFTKANTTNWVMSPYELVKLILNNKENSIIQNNLNNDTLSTLSLLLNIMNSSLNNVKYTQEELENLIQIDVNFAINIYNLYIITTNKTALTPLEFIDFILENQTNSLLSSYLSQETIKELNLLQTLIKSNINNDTYSSTELSRLLNIDQEQLRLLYALYDLKYLNINKQLSLYEFVNFLTTDLMNDLNYASLFNNTIKNKLTIIYQFMDSSLNNINYSSNELYKELTKLTNNLEESTIELIYIYYGSINNYQDDWTITIEQLINYINDDILIDTRFASFFNEDMKSNIKSTTKKIKKAKELLVGKKYSRLILNTSYNKEEQETFDFIKQLKNNLPKNTYIIGDSSMAYEMSLTFNDELDFITILTMISIFVVVACTFKSIIIPVILVLLIQCAVYMTMGILSLTKEPVYFIALLIVQSILMGSTIDYAILYTSYYLEHRKVLKIKEAIIESYNKSIHTILTSASILVIVTLVVGCFASATAAKICKTLSRGTLCSTILILLLLPGVLAAFDKLIIKKKVK